MDDRSVSVLQDAGKEPVRLLVPRLLRRRSSKRRERREEWKTMYTTLPT